ncbi:MAG: ATP-binding protein [Candidatus Nanoarchaeia archaeon]
MSYFIIIRGPLGIGKTTISDKLAKRLKGVHISMDKILEEYGLDKVSQKEETIPLRNFLKANKLILPVAKEHLKKGTIVIFDGNFQHKEQLVGLVEKIHYPHYAFNLKASVETCIARDKGRKRSYGEDAARWLHTLVSRYEYGINIDVEKKTPDKAVKEILAHLPHR